MTTFRDGEFPLDLWERATADDATGRAILVHGGAGTGKTHTLVARIVDLLRRGVSPDNITYLTPRTGGTEDMRRRLMGRYETRGRVQEMFVGTIHQYANYFLRNGGARARNIPSDYTIWDREHALEVMALSWGDYSEAKLRKMQFTEALYWLQQNQARWSDQSNIPAREGYWSEVVGAYVNEKRRQHALDLDDLLTIAVQAMQRNPDLRATWNTGRSKHLLVDEYEDITRKQCELLELMVGPSRSLMVATDPNQAIFEDQGADPSFMESFRLRFPHPWIIPLKMNQGSSKNLWSIAMALTSHPGIPGLQNDDQRCDGVNGPKPRLVEVEGTLQDMDNHFLDEVERLDDSGWQLEDMAYLYRKNGAVSRMRTKLAYRDIPYRVLGENRKGREDDARCLINLLTCLLNPWDVEAVRIAAAPGYPSKARRLNSGTSRNLRRLAAMHDANLIQAAEIHLEGLEMDSLDYRDLSYLVQAWRDLDRNLADPRSSLEGLCLRASELIKKARPTGPAPELDPGMVRLTRLLQKTPKLSGETTREHLVRFLDLLSPVYGSLVYGADRSDTGNAMTFSTIHAAKGRRWKIVFILDARDQTMPGIVGPYSERLRQEERVFYVAVTRATERLYWYSSTDAAKGDESLPSRFLSPLMDLLDRDRIERGRP